LNLRVDGGERLDRARHEAAAETVAHEVDFDGRERGLELTHDVGDRGCSDRPRPLLHDVPQRQIQKRADAAGDRVEHITGCRQGRIDGFTEAAQQSGPGLRAHLVDAFGRVAIRAVEQ